jgi:integrase
MGLQHAKSEGRISENVASDAKIPDASETKRRAFTPTELAALLDAIAGDRLEAAWLIQLGLGLRPGEVRALAWSDIEGDRLHVRHGQVREGGHIIARGRLKTESSQRDLQVPAAIQSALAERQFGQEAEAKVAGELWENPDGLIFTTERGQLIRPESYRRKFRAMLKRAGIASDDLVPHSFRHTTGSYLEEAGVPLGTISDLLGHKDMTMLVKRYRHSTTSTVSGHLLASESVLAGSIDVERNASSSKSSNAYSNINDKTDHQRHREDADQVIPAQD